MVATAASSGLQPVSANCFLALMMTGRGQRPDLNGCKRFPDRSGSGAKRALRFADYPGNAGCADGVVTPIVTRSRARCPDEQNLMIEIELVEIHSSLRRKRERVVSLSRRRLQQRLPAIGRI